MNFDHWLTDPEVLEFDITRPTLDLLDVPHIDELFNQPEQSINSAESINPLDTPPTDKVVYQAQDNDSRATNSNPLLDAIESINASPCSFEDFWQTMQMDPPTVPQEMTNSHLKPTGRILDEGTPWSSYEFEDTRTKQMSPTKLSLTNEAPDTAANDELPWDVFEFLDDTKYPRQAHPAKKTPLDLGNGVLVFEKPPFVNKILPYHETNPTQGKTK